ncbi:PhoD-like phosphatase [Seminavis robusta]|uniref:PhoD-like phosphatase n=1 Tax=Seminavis robusta TaxID=568900 RepID=A0A9N8HF58_9STRA|nr:PhoD-like phosphatase [Seminavis robusta]|eukprot:Sro508_g156890.1 PhoD-like phosphatase (735) ;mRNA; r:51948-54152
MPANSYCMLILGIMVIASIGFLASFATSWSLVDVQYAFTPAVAWIMVGGITSTSAIIKIKLPLDAHQGNVLLYLSPNNDEFSIQSRQEYNLGDTISTSSELESQYGLQTLQLTELLPQTKYYYKIQGDMILDEYEELLVGTFATPAKEGTRFNFTIAASACAWTGSRAAVFSEIQKDNPLLFLHMGDFHYADIHENNLQKRIDAISQVLASDTQSDLYKSTAISYMWDDHDFLGSSSKNSDNSDDGVEEEYEEGAWETALLSYQMAFPHYPLPSLSFKLKSDGDDQTVDTTTTNTTAAVLGNQTTATAETADNQLLPVPVYQAYTIGTVRFIISDLQSESKSNSNNNQSSSIFSDTQSQWLRQELSQAHLYDFVIWVTPKPWIGPATPGEDQWYGYPKERAELSTFITETLGMDNGPQNLLAIAGDAHMVAFDDGTNTYYGSNSNNNRNGTTTTTARSFPILQTASLDRVGGILGGPFTDDCYGYTSQRTHQFSVLRFEFAEGDNNNKCILIDTYSNDQYGKQERKLLFSKRLCNKIFVDAVVGDEAKVGVCELDELWELNDNIAVAASAILFATMVLNCIALNKSDADNLGDCLCKSCGTTIFYLVSYVLTGLVGFGTFFARGVDQADVTPVLIAVLCQSIMWFFYLFIWWACCTQSKRRKLGQDDPGFRDVEPNININISDLESTLMHDANADQNRGHTTCGQNQTESSNNNNNNSNRAPGTIQFNGPPEAL